VILAFLADFLASGVWVWGCSRRYALRVSMFAGDMWSLLLPSCGLRAQYALAFGIHTPHVSRSWVVPWGLSGTVLPHLSVRARSVFRHLAGSPSVPRGRYWIRTSDLPVVSRLLFR
jgi:hypothetical protein